MQKVQQFEISYSDSGDQMDELLDSDLLLTVLGADLFGRLKCQRVDAVVLSWSPAVTPPPIGIWEKVFSLGKVINLSEPKLASKVYIERRHMGDYSSSLETLVHYWLDAEGYSLPDKCVIFSRFKIDGDVSNAELKKIEAIFTKLASIESKSPLFDPKLHELKVSSNFDPVRWLLTLSEQDPFTQEKIDEVLISGNLSVSRQGAKISFARENTPSMERNIKSPIDGLARSTLEQAREDISFDILVSLPKRRQPKKYPWKTLFREIDSAVSVYSRAPSILGVRMGYSLCSNVTFLPAIPQLLKEPISSSQDSGLYFMGPWSAQNSLSQRGVEDLFRVCPSLVEKTMLLDSSDDWVLATLLMLKECEGFTLDFESFNSLYLANLRRSANARALLMRCGFDEAQEISQIPCPHPLRFRSLGLPNTSSKVDALDIDGNTKFTIEVSDLNSKIKNCFEQKIEGSFKVPNTKSTTFGYDRALIYPDQYMLKITNIPMMKRALASKQWASRSSSSHLHVQMRRPETSYLNTVKLMSSEKSEIVSWGSVRRTIDIDPLRSGHVAVDQAVRSHLCQGSSLKSLSAETFISCPKSSFKLLSSEQQIQIKLLLEGVNYACLQLNIDNLGERFLPTTDHNQEIFAWVRLKSFEPMADVANVFNGFRMNQESVVSLGPRPPFVDAGSRILAHVRVFSNYLTELDFEVQNSLYTRIAEMIRNNRVNCLYPVGPGGIAESLFEMALWGERGILLKPMINTIELFSGAPGRILVGVGEHEVEKLEREFESEKVLPVGTVSGDRVLGLSLDEIQKGRGGE
ncbi:hypothetical protein GW915_09875 [bacterium]|nr:hypothetical protein [bacterium]